MSYFRGLGAHVEMPPEYVGKDPWGAASAEPSVIDQVTSFIGSLFGGATAPATTAIPHPAPLTAAEQAKVLGTGAGASASTTAPATAKSKLPIILGVGLVGVVGFMLLKQPRVNPARRGRRARRRGRR